MPPFLMMSWNFLLVRMAGLYRAWCVFWFEADGYPQMHLFRRILAGLLFIFYLIRSIDLELYYSDQGIAPLSILSEIMDLRYRHSMFFFFSGVGSLWLLNGVFLAGLLSLMLGFLPRLSAWVVFLLHISFLHRNPGSVYGADMVATFFLFFMCLADFRFWSGSLRGCFDFQSMLGSVAYRLSQIQLCVIYAYAGLHKLKGVHWWNGEAVWAVFANSQMARWDFTWISHYPLLFILPTYATLLFEIYFPVLVWLPAARKSLLFFGFLLHLAIGLAMNIPIFALLMAFSYSLFLDGTVALRINVFLDRVTFFSQVKRKAADRSYV